MGEGFLGSTQSVPVPLFNAPENRPSKAPRAAAAIASSLPAGSWDVTLREEPAQTPSQRVLHGHTEGAGRPPRPQQHQDCGGGEKRATQGV